MVPLDKTDETHFSSGEDSESISSSSPSSGPGGGLTSVHRFAVNAEPPCGFVVGLGTGRRLE